MRLNKLFSGRIYTVLAFLLMFPLITASECRKVIGAASDNDVSNLSMPTDPTEPPGPTSAPSAAFRSAAVGLSVQFTDLTSGDVTTWSWDFGDLSGVSSEQNPLHTYAAADTYEARLTACNSAGCDTAAALVTVADP